MLKNKAIGIFIVDNKLEICLVGKKIHEMFDKRAVIRNKEHSIHCLGMRWGRRSPEPTDLAVRTVVRVINNGYCVGVGAVNNSSFSGSNCRKNTQISQQGS